MDGPARSFECSRKRGARWMLSIADLRKIAKARVRDAEVLRDAGRYDAAVYICGYAVETALKARICKTLKWSGYPATAKEFNDYSSLRTHDLEVLLHLSGREVRILGRY